MAVMAREAWTDERLDDFRVEVNRRFDQVDKRLDRIEGDIKELRQSMIHGFFVLVGFNATSTLTLVGLMVGLKVF
jgi:hypothetical protein